MLARGLLRLLLLDDLEAQDVGERRTQLLEKREKKKKRVAEGTGDEQACLPSPSPAKKRLNYAIYTHVALFEHYCNTIVTHGYYNVMRCHSAPPIVAFIM